MGTGRGRRVSLEVRRETIELVAKAQKSGARLSSICSCLGISVRTYERWCGNPEGDQRRGPLSSPANKLSEQERGKVLKVANSSEYFDKSPAQIVPLLADRGEYIASESSFYRILRAAGQCAHRQRSKPASRAKPKELVAKAPNEVWSWDITFLRSEVAGMFYYLYLVIDVYSRKIVGFEVHESQTSELASDMIERICQREGVSKDQLSLHSDNGKPMKGATMLATLQKLGVVPSFSLFAAIAPGHANAME